MQGRSFQARAWICAERTSSENEAVSSSSSTDWKIRKAWRCARLGKAETHGFSFPEIGVQGGRVNGIHLVVVSLLGCKDKGRSIAGIDLMCCKLQVGAPPFKALLVQMKCGTLTHMDVCTRNWVGHGEDTRCCTWRHDLVHRHIILPHDPKLTALTVPQLGGRSDAMPLQVLASFEAGAVAKHPHTFAQKAKHHSPARLAGRASHEDLGVLIAQLHHRLHHRSGRQVISMADAHAPGR
mmetsp:Transcript_71497/g.133710  ORF Transcript_71497/g.133710 Transcript_71497/m.133710 type:complete len:238 (+) Transcript_71497:187-900(+)